MNEDIEWSTSDKVPGYYATTKYGAGRMSIGAMAVVVALLATKTDGGALTPDSDAVQMFTADQALAGAGPRSTLGQMAEAAFEVPGANVVLVPVAEASGAVSATLTLTFGGTWSKPGEIVGHVGGKRIAIPISKDHTPTNVAATAVLSCGEVATLPVTATSNAAVTTMSVVSKGTQGNSLLFGWDMSNAPPGLTMTVAGGTALHPKLVPFSGGTGTESIANALEVLESGVYDYIAAAQTDATNAALLKAHVDSESSPTVAHLEHVIFGSNAAYATAASFASSTLNHPRCAVVWYENCETHPAVIAANAAAYRSSVVGGSPNHVYSGKALRSVVPQRYKSDVPNHQVLVAALNTGLTPLAFTDGYVRIVRDCTSKCLTGANPDYRTYGWPTADVPDRMRKELGALYYERREGNPHCGPDPIAGEAGELPGVETPKSFSTAATALWKEKERSNWLQDVDTKPIRVRYDFDRKCLMVSAPVTVRTQNLQMGAVISQISA